MGYVDGFLVPAKMSRLIFGGFVPFVGLER